MKKDKESKKRILASLVMGLNCVNSFAPMAVAVNMQQERIPNKPVKEAVAEPEQYTAAFYQALDVIDGAIFGTAEAAFTEDVGTAGSCTTNYVNGEEIPSGGGQHIGAGGTATNGVINGGAQYISAGGTGNVATMSSGTQNIYSGGTGTVDTMSGGTQTINASGSGTITTMSGGTQVISGISGNGSIDIMSGGTQTIASSGTGTVTTMRGGTQTINSSGKGEINNMNGGTQTINSSGKGEINFMGGGTQTIAASGSGTINDMSGGTQTIATSGNGKISNMTGGSQKITANGSGIISNMSGGTQTIDSKGSGYIGNMDGGTQTVATSGKGEITTMRGGTQTIAYRGSGYITTMSGGNQDICSVNTIGNITTMIGGSQTISGNGKGNIETMKGGIQYIYNGRGEITTMSGGLQNINNGSGSITTMSAGSQFISAGGTGTVENLLSGATQKISAGANGTVQNISNGGIQDIASGATGTLVNMSSGGGIQTIALGGTGIITNLLSGAIQEIAEGVVGSVTNMSEGASQNISSGGTGTVTALNGGQQTVSAGGTSLNTTLNGGTLAVLDNTAVVENASMDAGLIRFNGAGANYNLTGNFAARGGTVDLTKNADGTSQSPATYETLTIANLSNNGTNFIMNTDLNSETNGDKIVVQAAAANAGGTIQVYDSSIVDGNVSGPKKLLLVTDNSNITNWTGKSLDTGGLWIITPAIEKIGNNWYLTLADPAPTPTPTPTPGISSNPTAKTLDAFTGAAYGAWRNAITDDSLRMHLGDLRYNQVQPGLWARVKAGKLGAPGYNGSYQMYQVGIDQQFANTAFGFAIDHLVGSNDYLTGTGDNSMTNLSLYATNYHPSGVYSDVVVKAGKYNGDVSMYALNDSAGYGTWGYSASYELGKTIAKASGFFIEPQAQFVLGRLQGADYTSSKGMTANSDATTSFLGRVGFVAGRKLTKGGDYYFKANLWREFTGSGDINLSAVNSYGKRETAQQSTSHKDTWFTLGLGGNVKLAPMTHLYGDVEKTFGADIQKKWQVNAGVRWEF